MFGKCWPWRQRKYRLTLVGLDNAGKTTWLYRLQSREDLRTHPTIMSNLENVTYKNVQLSLWDLGGQDHHRTLWKHWHKGSEGLVFTIDSSDRTPQRISDAKRELLALLEDDKLDGNVVLVLANKQDVAHSMSAQEVAESLALHELPEGRAWYVQPTSALHGEGVMEGMDWLVTNLSTHGAVVHTDRGGKGKHYPDNHLNCALAWRAKLQEEAEEERIRNQEAERNRQEAERESELRREEARRAEEEARQRQTATKENGMPNTREVHISGMPATVTSSQFSHTSIPDEPPVNPQGMQAPLIPTFTNGCDPSQTREAQTRDAMATMEAVPAGGGLPGFGGASAIPTIPNVQDGAVPVYDCTDGTPGGAYVGSRSRPANWRVADPSSVSLQMQTPLKSSMESLEGHTRTAPSVMSSVEKSTMPQLINAVLRSTPNDKKHRQQIIDLINRREITSMQDLSEVGIDVSQGGEPSGDLDLNAAMLRLDSSLPNNSSVPTTTSVLHSANASYASPAPSKPSFQEGTASGSQEAGHRPVEWTNSTSFGVSYGDVDVAQRNLHQSIHQQIGMKKR